jgi:hypothetical protein
VAKLFEDGCFPEEPSARLGLFGRTQDLERDRLTGAAVVCSKHDRTAAAVNTSFDLEAPCDEAAVFHGEPRLSSAA